MKHPTAQWQPSPNFGGSLVRPAMVLMHYTAEPTLGGSLEWLCRPGGNSSAHFLVDVDGSLHQLVSLDRQAWHAGKSEWKGRPNCNAFSIGIEMVNAGELTRDNAGDYRTWRNVLVPEDRVIKKGTRFFDRFDAAQVVAVQKLLFWLRRQFPTLIDVAGHNEVAPGRKVDPGPAFDMAAVRQWWVRQ